MIFRKLLLAVLAALLPVGAFLAFDTYLHHRADRLGSYGHVNRWGYRGAPLGGKRAGEYRIAMVGGSTAFGLGTAVNEAIPAVLERRLRQTTGRSITVINLAFPADGAYADRWTLRHYDDLQYDAAIVYTGYNDLRGRGERNLAIHRQESAIFKLTGYYPWLSVVLKGKADEWRRAMTAKESGTRPTVTPKILFSTGAATLEFLSAFDRQARLSAQSLQAVRIEGGDDRAFWHSYLSEIDGLIGDLAATRRPVVLVLPPRYRASPDGIGRAGEALHTSQQNALRAFWTQRYTARSDVTLIDLSEALNPLDPQYAFPDRIHLTAAGNALVAERLVDPITAFLFR